MEDPAAKEAFERLSLTIGLPADTYVIGGPSIKRMLSSWSSHEKKLGKGEHFDESDLRKKLKTNLKERRKKKNFRFDRNDYEVLSKLEVFKEVFPNGIPNLDIDEDEQGNENREEGEDESIQEISQKKEEFKNELEDDSEELDHLIRRNVKLEQQHTGFNIDDLKEESESVIDVTNLYKNGLQKSEHKSEYSNGQEDAHPSGWWANTENQNTIDSVVQNHRNQQMMLEHMMMHYAPVTYRNYNPFMLSESTLDQLRRILEVISDKEQVMSGENVKEEKYEE